MRSCITFIIALAGIAQLLAEQRSDKIVIQGNPAGNQTMQTDAAGLTHVEYSYNDRGRGDHITATWKLDAAGSRDSCYLQYSGTIHRVANGGWINTCLCPTTPYASFSELGA